MRRGFMGPRSNEIWTPGKVSCERHADDALIQEIRGHVPREKFKIVRNPSASYLRLKVQSSSHRSSKNNKLPFIEA